MLTNVYESGLHWAPKVSSTDRLVYELSNQSSAPRLSDRSDVLRLDSSSKTF